MQQSLTQATYATVKQQANTLVKRSQQYSYSLLTPGINLRKAAAVAVSDASPGKMPRQGSQGGMFLLITTEEVTTKRVPIACMYWLPHRLKRVAWSWPQRAWPCVDMPNFFEHACVNFLTERMTSSIGNVTRLEFHYSNYSHRLSICLRSHLCRTGTSSRSNFGIGPSRAPLRHNCEREHKAEMQP